MSLLTVVTSFSSDGYEEYGRRCVESFKEFWPSSVQLICAWEGPGPGNLNGFDLLNTEPCASFIKRHKGNRYAKGRLPLPTWGGKARLEGYSFRHNAFKFARKVFAVSAAARYVQFGRLFWLDADVFTHKHVPEGLLFDLLPQAVSLCYLARPRSYTETGFVGYNLEQPETRAFITAYERMYSEDRFIQEPHWDDCAIFDSVVERLKPIAGLIAHNSQSQPFDNSILGKYMTHLKGKRKAA